MLYIFLECGWQWYLETDVFAINIREELNLFEDRGAHDVFKVGFSKSSIPVVDNMSTVHDLTENVDQIFKWNF